MKRACRNGYTLLEILLATSISLVLLAALYTSLKLHLTTAQSGPRAAQHSQLARAISELLRRDVAHLVLPQQTASVLTTLNPLPGQTLSVTRYSGLRGGETWIEIYTDQPCVITDRTSPTKLGISRIRYEVTRNSPATAGSTVGTLWSLTRTQVPAEFASAWDEGGQDAARWGRTDIVCDAIAEIAFQFWDGQSESWVRSWQPGVPAVPPTAFRLVFRLQSSLTQPGAAGNAWQSPHTVVIQVASDQQVDALRRHPGERNSQGSADRMPTPTTQN